MAEILSSRKSGGRRRPPVPRVDLTPMVDLGFLLITFFMFTTALAQPSVMELNMPVPAPPDGSTRFTAESTITLMPTANHRVLWYEGSLYGDAGRGITGVGGEGVRTLLLRKKKDAAALPESFSAQAHELQVIIKPMPDCTYEDVVRLLDEMQIVDVKFYALTKPAAGEAEAVKSQISGGL